MTEKKEEKKLLDLTTDEAMDFLFPKEVVDHLKDVAGKNNPPPEGENGGSKVSSKSARRHSNK